MNDVLGVDGGDLPEDLRLAVEKGLRDYIAVRYEIDERRITANVTGEFAPYDMASIYCVVYIDGKQASDELVKGILTEMFEDTGVSAS